MEEILVLIDERGNVVVEGKGIKGAWEKLFTPEHMSSAELDAKGSGPSRDKTEIFGFLHGAIKEPLKQFAREYANFMIEVCDMYESVIGVVHDDECSCDE